MEPSRGNKCYDCHITLIKALTWKDSKAARLHLNQSRKNFWPLTCNIFLKVGHSIGSYISIEMLRRSSERVIYCIALYPFLAVNTESSTQSIIMRLSRSPILCAAVSSIVGLLGFLPTKASRFLVTNSVGKTWSAGAIEALCSHLLQYHVMRNVLFLAMTEFKKLSETPDWEFMRGKRSQITFLFGDDDHWGPLQMFDEISKNVPDAALAIEREGHSHSFSCTTAGSLWVAQHVASLIKNRKANSSQVHSLSFYGRVSLFNARR